MRKLFLLLCLVLVGVFQNSVCALAADDPGDAIGVLLDSFASARGVDGKIAAWRQMLSKPAELKGYFETLFDEGKDPLLAQHRGKFAEKEISVLERRRDVALRLLGQMPLRLYRELCAAMQELDGQQRTNAVLLIDHLCEDVRPAVFRRALEHTDGDRLDFVLEQIRESRDRSLADAVRPFLRIDDSERSFLILGYLVAAAGELDVMRKFIDARFASGSLGLALEYARLAGDQEYATKVAIECVRQFADERKPPDGRFPPGDPRRVDQFADNRAVQAASVLARLNTTKARQTVMDLLQDEDCPGHIEEALLTALPEFFAEERMPLYEKAYGPDKRPYALASFLRWLEHHGSKAGLALAKARLKSILATWERPETWDGISYLLWCGDQETIDFLKEAAKGKNVKAFQNVVPILIEAGLWDQLPNDIDSKLVEASEGTEKEKNFYHFKLLGAAGTQRTPQVLPFLRFLADNAEDQRVRVPALCLILELGDQTVIPRLEEIYPEKLAAERVSIAAALYSAGGTDYLDDLCWVARSSGLSVYARIAAIKALAKAREGQRQKAFSVLAQLLLDRHIRVSDEAYRALLEVSNLEAIDFNPWANDETRRNQSAPLIKWLNSLQ